MERDLQILVNTKDHLVVDSPSESMQPVLLVVLLLLLGGLCYLVYRLWPVSRIAAVGTAVIALVVSLFVFANQSTSYRMDMDRARGSLVMTTYSGTDRTSPLKTYTDPLDAFTRADMEFDRNYRRITLSTHGGQQVHPLGPDYTIMDSQFNVLEAIQQFLGQQPSSQAR